MEVVSYSLSLKHILILMNSLSEVGVISSQHFGNETT